MKKMIVSHFMEIPTGHHTYVSKIFILFRMADTVVESSWLLDSFKNVINLHCLCTRSSIRYVCIVS